VSIFIDPKQSLMDYVNAANATTRFTVNNVLFSVPAPVAGTWREGTTTKNTYVKATAAPTADFKGKTILVYNRLQLGDFAKFRPTRPLPCYQVSTVHDILSNILYYYAIRLTTDDVENDPITLDGQGKGTVTVRAKAGSLKWLGSVTFDIVPGGALVDNYLQTKILNGLNYPVTDETTQTSALVYCYGLDFTAYRDQFLPIDDEQTITPAAALIVANALKAIDKGSANALWTGNPLEHLRCEGGVQRPELLGVFVEPGVQVHLGLGAGEHGHQTDRSLHPALQRPRRPERHRLTA